MHRGHWLLGVWVVGSTGIAPAAAPPATTQAFLDAHPGTRMMIVQDRLVGRYDYPMYSNPDVTVCSDTGKSCTDSSECNPGVPCTNALHPYVLNITAQAALGSCCDTVSESYTEAVAETDCSAAGQIWSCGLSC